MRQPGPATYRRRSQSGLLARPATGQHGHSSSGRCLGAESRSFAAHASDQAQSAGKPRDLGKARHRRKRARLTAEPEVASGPKTGGQDCRPSLDRNSRHPWCPCSSPVGATCCRDSTRSCWSDRVTAPGHRDRGLTLQPHVRFADFADRETLRNSRTTRAAPSPTPQQALALHRTCLRGSQTHPRSPRRLQPPCIRLGPVLAHPRPQCASRPPHLPKHLAAPDIHVGTAQAIVVWRQFVKLAPNRQRFFALPHVVFDESRVLA